MNVSFVHFGREHLGLEYLSAHLKNSGHEVKLFCDPGLFSREDNVFYAPFLEGAFKKKNIAKQVIESNPGLVCFSAYTTTFPWAKNIARKIKDALKAPIVFGGMHASLVPEKVLENDFIDYVIVGEGEQALLELVRSLGRKDSLSRIRNLCFKEKNKIVRNALRPPLDNLDELPLPDKRLFEKYVNFKDDYMIMTSRGCAFSCSYCCESHFNRIYNGSYFRRRSVANVINELKLMKARYHFKEVMFFDSILFTDKPWLKELCSCYRKEINVPFRCTGHINFLDREAGEILKDAGCYCIDFGVQTFNERIRRSILDRLETNEQIRKALSICDELKIKYDLDLMFGLPEAKLKDYLLAVDFVKRSKSLNRLKCYYLSYFPGTPIIEKSKQLGLLDEHDISGINEGKIGDWFHVDSVKAAEDKILSETFTKIYKVYPLIPGFIRGKIAGGRMYKYFRFMPNFLVIAMQLLIAAKNNDYCFKIYINNYLTAFSKIRR